MEIKTSDRVFITGKTGSGKSYWIQKHLNQIPSFFIYDPKHTRIYNEVYATEITNVQDLQAALAKGIKKIIYRPFVVDDEAFDLICKLIYNTGNMTFIVDEMAFHVNNSKIMPYHSVLIRMGRERGIGIWNCTQRPRACLHNTILSETDHIICFKLMLETDRKKLAESFDPLFLEAHNLGEFCWIYYNTSEDHARAMNPV